MIPLRFVNNYRLPEKYHKGKKIMDQDRQIIRDKYFSGNFTYRVLAKEYKVSYGTIQCIINEDTRQKNLNRSKKWRKDNNIKTKNTMELRYLKRDLINKGIININ